MKECTALELIRLKMAEMEITDYLIRYRHIKLYDGESRTIRAKNDLFFLIEPDEKAQVKSRTGIFDLVDKSAREMQYIHSDKIELKSLEPNTVLSIKFLQVIPNQTL